MSDILAYVSVAKKNDINMCPILKGFWRYESLTLRMKVKNY